MSEEENILNERKEKLKDFFIKKNLWIYIALVLLVILGIYIRSMPMQDHGGQPGLWDITRNTWTLGPDLDPFLFMRYEKSIIEIGSIPLIDKMRNVPLGFDTSVETQLLPYMMAFTYNLWNTFSSASIEYSAVIFPVIMFALTIISFFFFVREVFKKNKHGEIIALLSTLMMILIPVFLPRTIAGIPEKESAAFFFMFLSFWFFLKGWKSEKLRNGIIFGALAGISTALMGLLWGGVLYIFITIGVTSLIAFVLNKIHKKEIIVYACWLVLSFLIISTFTGRTSIMSLITSLDSGLAFLVLFIFCVDALIWKTKIKDKLEKIKLPRRIVSIIVSIILIIILATILLGPGFIIQKIEAIQQMMFKPIQGRWNTTVAENRQPYFAEWAYEFGPVLKNIPILFWVFIIGSVVLFKNMLNNLKKKDSWILTGLYVLFLFGMIFSRYAPHPSILDGENFLSKFMYYGSAIILIGYGIYLFNKYEKENDSSIKNLDYELIFLFSLLVLCLFTARGAIRLVMVLGPIAPIFASYLAVFVVDRYRNSKEESKIYAGIAAVIILLLFIYILIGIPFSSNYPGFWQMIKSQAYGYVPSSYTFQWQKAMSWVRTNTTENSVFAHWWDYGYWVQSLGERATVTDGGNAIVWWNYLTGRLVLTGDNQKDSLEFLYNHNASYLLIDPTDLGKYGAFSSIGSNENFDRYSPGPIGMVSDSKQNQETKNGMIRAYQWTPGWNVEEDINYDNNGTKIKLASEKTYILGIVVENVNESVPFKQPMGVYYSNGQQIRIPLRYLYYDNEIYDFKSGLEAAAYIIPYIIQTSAGIQIDNTGALIYISPRLLRGFLGQDYLLNNALGNFPNFELAHSQPSPIVESLNSQGAKLNEFVYYQGIQGPIKIWKIKYAGDEKINPEYTQINVPDYITWRF